MGAAVFMQTQSSASPFKRLLWLPLNEERIRLTLGGQQGRGHNGTVWKW